jgi:predicted DNA-binding transcriptional regulator
MASIQELRERLKNKRRERPVLPYRTCVEILVKMDKAGMFGTPGLIFSVDGQEILTPAILDQEIIATLTEEFDGRCRVSELARTLKISEDTIFSRLKSMRSISLFLNDVIMDSWFINQVPVVQRLVNRAGEIKISQIAEKMLISAELFEARILSIIPPEIVSKSPRGTLISPRFLEIINVRVRGLLNGLDVPRHIDWIASSVHCPKESIEQIVSPSEVGKLGKDGIFIPNVWIKKQITQAYELWDKLHWIPLAALRLEIGNAKSDLATWLNLNGLMDGENSLILSLCVLRITDNELSMVREALVKNEWINIDNLVSGKMGFQLSGEDGNKILKFFRNKIIEMREWILISDCVVSHKLIARLSWKRNWETLVENEFSGSEISDEIHALVEVEVRKRELVESLPVPERLEGILIEQFSEIGQASQAVKAFENSEILLTAMRENLLTLFLQNVFRFAAVRFCGMNVKLGDPVDLEKVVKSLPTVAGQKSEYESILKDLLENFEKKSVLDLEEWLKQILGELGIVIPKKRSRFVNEYKAKFECAVTCEEIIEFGVKIFLSKTCGSSVEFLGTTIREDIVKLAVPADLVPLFLELQSPTLLIKRMFEIKDSIFQHFS